MFIPGIIEYGGATVFATLSSTYRSGTYVALSNGNLTYSGTTGPGLVAATIGKSSGKWYWELRVDNNVTVNNYRFGIINNQGNAQTNTALASFAGSIGYRSRTICYAYNYTGSATTVGSGTCGTINAGDIFSFAFDAGAGTLNIYKNGSTTASAAIIGIPAGMWYPTFEIDTGGTNGGTVSFGQVSFSATTATLRASLSSSGYSMGVYT